MTGPEHLVCGKELLTEAAAVGEATPAGQAMATAALAHLTAAQVCAYAAVALPERVSWTEASET